MPVSSHKGERSCICVLEESILPLFLLLSITSTNCLDGVVFFYFFLFVLKISIDWKSENKFKPEIMFMLEEY